MKGKYQIFSLLQKPGLKQEGALWFHEKWNIPEEAYLESMEESLREHGPVPQWYLALDEEQIIGGLALPGNCGSSFGTGLQGHGPAGDQHTIFADGPYLLL